jgi:hypothetical protein
VLLIEILNDLKNNYVCCLISMVAVVYDNVCAWISKTEKGTCIMHEFEGHPMLEVTELLQAGL